MKKKEPVKPVKEKRKHEDKSKRKLDTMVDLFNKLKVFMGALHKNKKIDGHLAQEEGDESAATVDPDVVWRQTLSEPCKNRVYGADGFFASSLRRSGYGGSSASSSSTHTGPAAPEVVDLREQVQNLSQSLQTQGHMLQQHIDEVRTLKDTLAERDARAEEHLKRMEEMQRQMVAFYDPLRPGSSAAVGGSGSSTAPPLPPRSPPRHPAPEDGDDDDDYEDA
ncbi:hypothetical protein PIB30_084643 [Stylosanthes scabra]|uniref:Uncharacterized protein n=1 Tax=Stylosanthes scabra TaxID=79078 RepID=A0ABU6WW46_9FABA|nr:hypothetical protein [Stylosanthes scabra]